MNNKGYALTGILYTALIVFATIMIALLFNLQNRKTILNELKEDVADAANSEANYNYLYSELEELKKSTGTNKLYTIVVEALPQNLSKIADYPDGLTMNNCVILSYMVLSESYSGWTFSSDLTIVLKDDGLYASTTEYTGSTAKIVLYQYN